MNAPSSASPGAPRTVVLHADDFGLSPAATDGIALGFEHGLLGATSVLAQAPDASRALRLWKSLVQRQAAGEWPSGPARRALGEPDSPVELGVHLNLTQGRPLTQDRFPRELLDADGFFPSTGPLYAKLLRHGRTFRAALRDELAAQIAFVLDHGLRPAHLDGHQYVELFPTVSGIVLELLDRFAIPAVRVAREPRCGRHAWATSRNPFAVLLAWTKRIHAERFARVARARAVLRTDQFCGTSHAGRVDLRLLDRFLAAVPCGARVEIGLHPGRRETPAETEATRSARNGWDDPLAALRPNELEWLTGPALVELLARRNVRLGRLAGSTPTAGLRCRPIPKFRTPIATVSEPAREFSLP